MAFVTSWLRARLWRRVLAWAFFLLVVLVLIGYAMAPMLTVWYATPRLPWKQTFPAGNVIISAVASHVTPAHAQTFRPDVQVLITADRARDIAQQASGYWIPPGLLRSSQQVSGSLSLPILRPQSFLWQGIIGGADPAPLASVIINNVELSAFLREYGRTVVTYSNQPILWCTYVVKGGRISDVSTADTPPLTRRLWVEAHGTIILQSGTAQRSVPVRHLAGHATVTYTPDAGGYRMAIIVQIEESDVDELVIPAFGDVRAMLLKQLEKAANDGLQDGLEKVWLPPWVPLDTRVSVVVE